MSEADESRTRFKIGDCVEKHTGDYNIAGVVRAVFTVYHGGPFRYVVRHEAAGGGFFCHIYSDANLRASPSLEEADRG